MKGGGDAGSFEPSTWWLHTKGSTRALNWHSGEREHSLPHSHKSNFTDKGSYCINGNGNYQHVTNLLKTRKNLFKALNYELFIVKSFKKQ